jgi:hypothetical protein
MHAHTTAGEWMMFSTAEMLPDNRGTMASMLMKGWNLMDELISPWGQARRWGDGGSRVSRRELLSLKEGSELFVRVTTSIMK